jgi:hypothetical protein
MEVGDTEVVATVSVKLCGTSQLFITG